MFDFAANQEEAGFVLKDIFEDVDAFEKDDKELEMNTSKIAFEQLHNSRDIINGRNKRKMGVWNGSYKKSH